MRKHEDEEFSARAEVVGACGMEDVWRGILWVLQRMAT